MTRTISLKPGEGEKRMDALIASSLSISRSRAQSMIANGLVRLPSGEVITENSHIARVGIVYILLPTEEQPVHSSILPNPNIPLNIIHEDSDLIIIDKTPNIAVHPGYGTKNDTIVNALLAHCGNSINSVGSSARPGIVHRLDKGTSGLMVVAKTEDAYYALSKALMEKQFRKEYLAIVWGIPNPTHGFVKVNISVKRSDITAMQATKFGGKTAITEYRVEKAFGKTASLVRCILHTGRTHQIRVHMSYIGHSIIGDQKYGKNSKKCVACEIPKITDFNRQALHSCLLEFKHPSTGKNVKFLSSPSYDMQQLIEALTDLSE